jgi:hypothetical protein
VQAAATTAVKRQGYGRPAGQVVKASVANQGGTQRQALAFRLSQ